jgi:hypothetical protein
MTNGSILLIAAAVFFLCFSLPASAYTYTVTILNDEDDGDYSDPDLSLREAIRLANENPAYDTVDFAPGLSGTITLSLGQLTVSDGVVIFGDGATNLTVSGNSSSRVFLVDDGDTNAQIAVTISGLKISGGTPGAGENGGGVLSRENLTLMNCVISGNQTRNGNNGVDNSSGNATSGSGSGSGGGIYSEGALSLSFCTIVSNSTGNGGSGGNHYGGFTMGNGGSGASSGAGGAIYSVGVLHLTNCGVCWNRTGAGGAGGSSINGHGGSAGSSGEGGGIWNGSTLDLVRCTVTDNSTGNAGAGGSGYREFGGNGGNGGSGGSGGGIRCGVADFSACTVANNITGAGGAGGSGGGEYPTENGYGGLGSGGGHGGGVDAGGSLAMVNCRISGNRTGSGGSGGWGFPNGWLDQNRGGPAGSGGGVSAWDACLSCCSLVGNAVGANANNALPLGAMGGGYFGNGTLKNCILYYNSAPIGSNYEPYHSVLSNCCATPLAPGVGNITNEPQFVDLAATNFHLLGTSPCVNAGTNEAWMTGATDLDGHPRLFEGIVDMGAYELFFVPAGIPAEWLARFNLPTNGSMDYWDSDTDGSCNWEEYQADTDPTNGSSFLPALTTVIGTDVLVIEVPSTSTERVYKVYWRTNLLPEADAWIAIGEEQLGNGSNITIVVTNNLPVNYYRVSVHAP